MFRGRSTLIYLVLALGLLCYLTFVDKKFQGTDERAKAQLHLLTFTPDDVTGLEITNVHGTFNFQRATTGKSPRPSARSPMPRP